MRRGEYRTGMPTSRGAIVSVVLGLALAAVGCKSKPRVEDEPQRSAATQPAFAEPVRTAPLLAFRQEPRRFVVTLGPRKGQILASTLTEAGGGRWRFDLENTRTVYLQQTDSGTYVEREIDVEEQVEVLYEPALQMVPDTLTPGRPQSNEVTMIVRNLADGRERDRGSCSLTCEYVGTRAVDTPAGEFEAHVVRATRNIDLKLAKVTVEIETAYVMNEGTFVELIHRDTKALGLFSIKTEEELRRQDK
jgi:hypothetical protein